MVDTPAWERRFTAPQMSFPAWIDSAPDHLAFASNESGSWQVWATDLVSGERGAGSRDEPVGVEEALVSPDGRVVWWQDDIGDETGRWMAVAFDGAGARALGRRRLPTGWRQGISFAGDGRRSRSGSAPRTDYRAYFVTVADGSATLVRTGRGADRRGAPRSRRSRAGSRPMAA